MAACADPRYSSSPIRAEYGASGMGTDVCGDRGQKYISYLDEEWWKTSDLLYDTKEHLYARDASYSTKTEANGQKMFWGRGNGCVMGGIARTL